jgi:hypothetical protein
METRLVAGRAPRVRLLGADGLTASRIAVVLWLLVRPSPKVAVALVVWAWLSDAVDGPLARSTGSPGRLAEFDHRVDALVGFGMTWYLGDVGFLPTVSSRLLAVLLLGVWAATGIFAAQMLFQTAAYGAFLWWAFATSVAGRWWLPWVALLILVAEWARFVTEFVPDFLRGIRKLVGRRHPDG